MFFILDFICTGFVDLWGMDSVQNIKMKVHVSSGIWTSIIRTTSWRLGSLSKTDRDDIPCLKLIHNNNTLKNTNISNLLLFYVYWNWLSDNVLFPFTNEYIIF